MANRCGTMNERKTEGPQTQKGTHSPVLGRASEEESTVRSLRCRTRHRHELETTEGDPQLIEAAMTERETRDETARGK